MIPNKSIGMLDAWDKNAFAELSISEIMEHTGKKTKPWVFNVLKALAKYNLLVKKRKGNINLYTLSLDNPLLVQTLQFLEIQNNYNFTKLDVIKEIISKTPPSAYCLLVFGSYAEGKQTKESDLDVCFLIESAAAEKKIKSYFNEIKLATHVNIDEHYITFSDFIKMLLRDEENLAKQIFRNRRIFFGADIYYKLIMEAHKNGFRP